MRRTISILLATMAVVVSIFSTPAAPAQAGGVEVLATCNAVVVSKGYSPNQIGSMKVNVANYATGIGIASNTVSFTVGATPQVVRVTLTFSVPAGTTLAIFATDTVSGVIYAQNVPCSLPATTPSAGVRTNTTPGERVAVFCYPDRLEVFGILDNSSGIFLANFNASRLVAAGGAGLTVDAGVYGRVAANATATGSFNVLWVGGSMLATGTGDYAKNGTCAFAFTGVVTGATPTPVTVIITPPAVIYPPNTYYPPVVVGRNVYVVKAGDNFFRIALRYGLTVPQLQALNPGVVDPARIYVGQYLIVP